MSVCRSCGAQIKWARFADSRKNVPLDAAPVANGNIELGEWDGPFHLVRVVAPGEGTHVSHFTTCPNAKAHRKER